MLKKLLRKTVNMFNDLADMLPPFPPPEDMDELDEVLKEKKSNLPPYHIKKNGVVYDMTPPVIGGRYVLRDMYEEFGLYRTHCVVLQLGTKHNLVLFDHGSFKDQTCELAVFNNVWVLLPEEDY